jgi:hypothetical protein
MALDWAAEVTRWLFSTVLSIFGNLWCGDLKSHLRGYWLSMGILWFISVKAQSEWRSLIMHIYDPQRSKYLLLEEFMIRMIINIRHLFRTPVSWLRSWRITSILGQWVFECIKWYQSSL